jgi:hypothetical protein
MHMKIDNYWLFNRNLIIPKTEGFQQKFLRHDEAIFS